MVKELDFKQRLIDFVNNLDIEFRCKTGALSETSSLVLNEIAGSRTVRAYYDGVEDKQLNFEFACKSDDIVKTELNLNKIAVNLEKLKELASNNGSFEFSEINTTSGPFLTAKDERGLFIYRLVIQANVTTYLK